MWLRSLFFHFLASISCRAIYRSYNEKGKCFPIGGAHKSARMKSDNLPRPSKLYWDITPNLSEIIDNAVKLAVKNNSDVQHVVATHDAFGKGFIKKCKVRGEAPDMEWKTKSKNIRYMFIQVKHIVWFQYRKSFVGIQYTCSWVCINLCLIN